MFPLGEEIVLGFEVWFLGVPVFVFPLGDEIVLGSEVWFLGVPIAFPLG